MPTSGNFLASGSPMIPPAKPCTLEPCQETAGGLQAGIPTSRVFIAAGGLPASPAQSPFTSATNAATFSSVLLFLLLLLVCLLGPTPPYCYLRCCYGTNTGCCCCCYCYCVYNDRGKLLQTLLLLLLPVTAPGSSKCTTNKDYCCFYI